MREENENKKLLVVVDMVNGFAKEGVMADKSIMNVVPKQKELIEKIEKEGGKVIFICEGHNEDSTEFTKFPAHCIKGTKEAEVVYELKEYVTEENVYIKNSTNGVFAEGFLKDFDEKYKDIDEVIVAGCCTDICVTNFALPLITYADQNNRKLDLVIPENVVETYDAPNHKREEVTKAAFRLLKQSGVKVVEDYETMKDVVIENEEAKEPVKKLIDFYELTMAYSDFLEGKDKQKCYFDVFFRKNLDEGGYNISCGLDEIINFIENFKFEDDDIEYLRSLGKFNDEFLTYLKDFKFHGDIFAIPDGTPIFPGEPVITVAANSIEAQLLETDILNRFNHGSMIATKTRRIVNEADGRPVMEFGARRAQGDTAAAIGAKHAYIGGAAGTSCYETGKRYGIPVLGTMAHSHVMKYDDEKEAFEKFAKAFPNNSTLLVDTYDTLRSGVPNAIKVAKEYLEPNGYRLSGIRLDSGDLAYLSKEARKQLDKAGCEDAKICVSNSLDEYLIRDLLQQGAPIDSFGVGENLITSKNCPVFGGVYKLAAIENENGEINPKIKISSTQAKVTNPGYKKVYRFIDKETGYAKGDVIALYDEEINEDHYKLVDDKEPWKFTELRNYDVVELQKQIYKDGKLVYDVPTVKEARAYADQQIKTLYPEVMRLTNPHEYFVDLSEDLAKLKQNMLMEAHEEIMKRNLELDEKETSEVVDAANEIARIEIEEENQTEEVIENIEDEMEE